MLLASCSVGKDSVLFITKTSFGVDIDGKPPTFSVGYDRQEGTLAPVTEGGKVLPQLASFASTAGFPFQAAVGQSFATGNAAILFSRYLVSTAGPDLDATIAEGEIDGTAFDGINSLPADVKRKRYFFGTDTSWALKVSFALEAGGYPDAISLGYKRKELAFVPLIPKETDANSGDLIHLPALLATAGLTTNVPDGSNANIAFSQFFATGQAANNLAALPDVRLTVGRFIVPEASESLIKAESRLQAAKAAEAARLARLNTVTAIQTDIGNLSDAHAIELAQNPAVEDAPPQQADLRFVDDACVLDLKPSCTAPGAATFTNAQQGAAARKISNRRVLAPQLTDEDLQNWQSRVAAIGD